jgi:hypothetical protein
MQLGSESLPVSNDTAREPPKVKPQKQQQQQPKPFIQEVSESISSDFGMIVFFVLILVPSIK